MSSSSPKHSVRSVALRLGAAALGLLLAACAAPGDENVDVDVDVELDTAGTRCTKFGCEDVTLSTTSEQTTTYKAPTVSVCSPISVAKLYGNNTRDFYNKNARLSKIDTSTSPWRVACVHAVDSKHAATTCAFDRYSQSFLLATTGEYFAKAGHSVDVQKGTPDGDYAIGTRASIVDGKYVAPCVSGASFDSAGEATGTELASSCVVETLNVETNTTGVPVKNYATLEVWTNSEKHPDDAARVGEGLVSGISVYSYLWEGAGMNDVNGTERDSGGVYYPDEKSCHVTISDGVETMAAKRPATKTFPVEVNKNSPIHWRPVDSRSKIKIAN